MKLFPVLLLLLPLPSLAVEIEVRALFSGAAMFVIDGENQLLKKGQISRSGVELIDASRKEAVVQINGQTRTLQLSDRISSTFERQENVKVLINMAANRQYITAGSINGRPVRYLVDTGANIVAINANTAKMLGLSVEDGVKVNASTASEDLQATMVMVEEMVVGDITRNNVQAIIIDGENPKDILLGMSFLQHVDISEKAGLMVLTSKL
ncbi:MAG: retropepsin-like aspartic protease [Proteobacteria bacterium]|nr:retropepsin-like aspartic protease [Pseudomonadota bacterium]